MFSTNLHLDRKTSWHIFFLYVLWGQRCTQWRKVPLARHAYPEILQKQKHPQEKYFMKPKVSWVLKLGTKKERLDPETPQDSPTFRQDGVFSSTSSLCKFLTIFKQISWKKCYTFPWKYVPQQSNTMSSNMRVFPSQYPFPIFFSFFIYYLMNFLVFIRTKPNSPIAKVYWGLQWNKNWEELASNKLILIRTFSETQHEVRPKKKKKKKWLTGSCN